MSVGQIGPTNFDSALTPVGVGFDLTKYKDKSKKPKAHSRNTKPYINHIMKYSPCMA